ncbi:MAG: hypothetical protein HC898_05445 [Phycisphaerales bacterium]|nr:hypothetical protein [Phycisphaerales bacterium]
MVDTPKDRQWSRLIEEQISLYDRYFYAIAYRVLRHRALAEEACQQGLMKVWSRRDRYP